MLVYAAIGLFGCLALIGGAIAVMLRNPVYAVLSLVKSMIGIAIIYFLLSAEYIGAIQIIVYAGAILVAFLFVVMLVNLSSEDIPPLPRGLPLYGGIGLALGWMLLFLWAGFSIREVPSSTQFYSEETLSLPYLYGSVAPLGKTLFTAYAFPFELLSLTLIVGMISASLLVKRKKEI
ncbi:MAG: NADH-quinone oxidoreductase subunit J [Bacteroidia bacterium]|nr:NADH-quinone oxidoreductase subunit J [Bacteroidia bacterium]MDW8133987.1 NADH-quinone oxidoreductase subunit J [Bacteroidia bacterium]